MSIVIKCEKIIYKSDNFLKPYPVRKNMSKNPINKIIKNNALRIKIKNIKNIKINIAENKYQIINTDNITII